MLSDLFGTNDDDTCDIDSNQQRQTSFKAKDYKPKPPALKSSSGFVGLENQGATCYLNSLIQAMYMTPELRNGLFQIDPDELGVTQEETTLEKKIIDSDTVEIDESLLESLLSMGVSEIHARKALLATKNGGFDQVFDYIEKNEHTQEFNASSSQVGDTTKKKKRKVRHIPLELQYLFAQLKMADRQAVSTQELTTKGFEWQGVDGQVQHDAHELNRLLIDAIEKSLKRTSGEKLCESLYMGRVVNTIRCCTCGYTSEREESFYDCNMQVIGCPSLVDSLRQYCAAEMLEGDSAYQCDVCKKKQAALRSTVLRSVPPILTFSCNRFRIDHSTNWQRVKVTSRHEFPLLIDMSAFSECTPHSGGAHNCININAAIQTDSVLEGELVSQLRHNTVTLSHAVEVADKWADIIYQRCDVSLPAATMTQQINAILTSELESNSAAYNTIMQELYGAHFFSGDMIYKLHAVIMHRGSAYSGHYFAFIRDSEQEGNWEMPEPIKVKAKDPLPPKKSISTKVAEVPLSPATHSNALQYYMDIGSATLFVNKDGPVGAIVTVLIMQHLFLGRNRDHEGARTSAAKGAIKEAAESIEGSVTQWASIPLSILGREIAICTGNSWANQFKPVFGALEGFIGSHRNIFDVDTSSKSSSVNLNRSLIREVLMYHNETFNQEVQRFIMPAPAAIVASETAPVQDSQKGSNASDSLTQDAYYFDECTEDEVLARVLQQSLDEDENSQPLSTAAATEGDWEVAGTKKKEKKTVKKDSKPLVLNAGKRAVKAAQGIRTPPRSQKESGALPKAAASPRRLPPPPQDSGGSAATTELSEEPHQPSEMAEPDPVDAKSEEEQNRIETLRYIKNSILNKLFGPFFNFNDSVVTSMEVASLQAAFEGQDSAYLLVYRRETAQSMGLLPPPKCWQDRVDRMNATISSERLAYDMSNRMITVCVRSPKHLQSDLHPSPLLKPSDGNEEGNYILRDFDGRQTVQEFLDAFLSEHSNELDELGLGFCRQDGRLVHEYVCIHTLEFFAKLGGFHVANKVDVTCTLSDALKDGGNILLWNGRFINKISVSTGPAAFPYTAAVFHLDFSSSNTSRSAAEVRRQISPLCLPFALSLGDLCSAIASRFEGLSKSTLCIHIAIKSTSFMSILNKKVSQTSTSASSSSSSRVGEKRQQVTAFNFCEKGSFSAVAKNNLFPWLMSSKGRSVSNVSLWDLCFGEFVDLFRSKNATVAVLDNCSHRCDVELWVEDFESRGLRTQSVAELFATQWNNSLTVEVVLRFDPSKIEGGSLKTAATVNVDGNGTDSACDEKESGHVNFDHILSSEDPAFGKVKVEVSILSTVKDLKLKAFAAFNLNAAVLSDSVFVKTVDSLDDESVGVLSSGIGEGKTVSLCVKSEDEEAQNATRLLKMKVILIGDCEVGGVNLTRVHLKEAFMDVPRDSTITSIRDKAGVLLLDYPPEWTLIVPKTKPSKDEAVVSNSTSAAEFNPIPMRLRKATWMGEAGQLLIEGRADVAAPSSLTMATIESAGLRDGDILLLEEGAPPIKGSSLLKVYVWQPLNYSHSTGEAATASLDGMNDNVSSPALPTGNNQRLERLDALVTRRQRCLLPLADIVAVASDSIDDLYQRIHEALVKLPDCSLVSLSQLLLRELRSDLLPGKCHWGSFHSSEGESDANAVKKKVVVAQDMNSMLKDIGVGGRTHAQKKEDFGTKNNSSAQTLRRACLVGDRSVAIELLPSLSGTKPPQGAFRIWVHLLTNPSCKEGLSEMYPEWPPLQGIVSGGTNPTLGHLKRAICSSLAQELLRRQKQPRQQPQQPALEQQLQQLSTATVDFIAVYKFNPHTVQWTQLLPPATGRKSENITQNPYSVKEGDQFCVHIISGSMNKAGGMQPPTTTNIARPEDLDLKILREEEKQQKEEKKRSKKVLFLDNPDNILVPRRKETLLMIGRGGEFSDEDEDEDGGGAPGRKCF